MVCWGDVQNVNAQCTCACGGTRAGGCTVRSAVAVDDEMAGSCFWRATRALLGPVVRQPGRQYGVVMLLSDEVTPDTDWLSVLMCRERTGPS